MSSPTLSDAVQRFLLRFDSPFTLRAYHSVLKSVMDLLGPDTPVKTITAEDLDDWNAWLKSRDLAAATRATRRKHVKAFFNWCVQRRYTRESPARFLDTKVPHQELISKAIPEGILVDMINAAPYKPQALVALRDTAILALLANYGARAGDVAWLTLGHVNLEKRWIVLRVKGGKETRLPLFPEVISPLSEWLDFRMKLDPDPPHQFVFVNIRTAPGKRYGALSSAGIQTMIARLSKAVSGTTYRPHSIRHWRGQSLADAGVPITVTQAILGHEDSHTTAEHYYNQDVSRVENALRHHQPGTSHDPQD